MRTAASASVSVFPSTNWDKSARYFTPQRSRSLILARRFGKYEIRVELRNVPRYECVILAAGRAVLHEIPSVSYVLPDVQEFIQIQGPSRSRQLSKWRVWNFDDHKYRVLRGRSDRNCGWWWIYASWTRRTGIRCDGRNARGRPKVRPEIKSPDLKLQIDIKSNLIYWVVLFMAGLLRVGFLRRM